MTPNPALLPALSPRPQCRMRQIHVYVCLLMLRLILVVINIITRLGFMLQSQAYLHTHTLTRRHTRNELVHSRGRSCLLFGACRPSVFGFTGSYRIFSHLLHNWKMFYSFFTHISFLHFNFHSKRSQVAPKIDWLDLYICIYSYIYRNRFRKYFKNCKLLIDSINIFNWICSAQIAMSSFNFTKRSITFFDSSETKCIWL